MNFASLKCRKYQDNLKLVYKVLSQKQTDKIGQITIWLTIKISQEVTLQIPGIWVTLQIPGIWVSAKGCATTAAWRPRRAAATALTCPPKEANGERNTIWYFLLGSLARALAVLHTALQPWQTAQRRELFTPKWEISVFLSYPEEETGNVLLLWDSSSGTAAPNMGFFAKSLFKLSGVGNCERGSYL